MKETLLTVMAAAAIALNGSDLMADETNSILPTVSFNAYADIETAYLCRGAIYDVRPFSAQYAATAVDFGLAGIVEGSVWTYSAMSPSGHSARMSRYAYAEADYLLRYYYDIDIAEGWSLRNGLGKQWVTNPGFCGAHTVVDWQALQMLNNPYITPYWRLRVIRRPFEETYWVLGMKRSFEIVKDLSFTADFFGDVGDRRQMYNLFGDWAEANGRRMRGALHALSLVFRLDYKVIEHVGLFAFAGQFCVVGNDARDAMKAAHIPEGKRDITYGGAGVAVDF